MESILEHFVKVEVKFWFPSKPPYVLDLSLLNEKSYDFSDSYHLVTGLIPLS